jgi:tetratricopeptide (TPR) repeat protein
VIGLLLWLFAAKDVPCSGPEYRAALDAKSPAASETLFRRAAEADPQCAAAELNLGLALAEQGRLAEAERTMREALRITPDWRPALVALGKLLYRLDRKGESIHTLQRAVAVDPKSSETRIDLGIALAQSEDREGALAAFTEAVRLAPKSARGRRNRGRVLLELLRYEDAVRELEAARSLDAGDLDTLHLLALSEKALGHTSRTAELARQLVARDPQSADAHFLLGQSLLYLGRNDEAITHLKRAVAIDGEYTEALYALSRGLAGSDPEGARMFAARLEALKRRGQDADQAKMLQGQGIASARAGDWKKSIARYSQALELCGECPLRADLEKSLGLSYCHAGSPDLGEPHLLVAQKLKPGDPDIERSLALIAELRRRKTR